MEAEEKKSTSKVEVVIIDEILPHPNADRMGIVMVHGGYQICVSLTDWKVGDKAAYIPPDNIVPDIEEYAWLKGKLRIKAKKLRGVVSFGLLIPAPDDCEVGDDISDRMGITHYEPPIQGFNGMKMGGMKTGYCVEGPEGYHPKYDVDALRRYRRLFVEGEQVVVTEKLDGTNFRACAVDGKIHVGSRNEWKEEADDNIYWNGLRNSDGLSEFLLANPDLTVYAELVPCQVRGKVRMTYGCDWGKPKVFIYDILRGTTFLDYAMAKAIAIELPWVPMISYEEFDFDRICALAEGPSMVEGADHLREGVVVCPRADRVDARIGRVKMKVVSASFLEL